RLRSGPGAIENAETATRESTDVWRADVVVGVELSPDASFSVGQVQFIQVTGRRRRQPDQDLDQSQRLGQAQVGASPKAAQALETEVVRPALNYRCPKGKLERAFEVRNILLD